MAENRKSRQELTGSTPLAQEYAKRRRRRKRRPSKAMRYFAAILVIILVFFIAYSVGSWIIKNVSSAPEDKRGTETDDPVTTLQKRLDELTSENKMLSEEIRELQSKVDKYNALYGPIDSSSGNNQDTPAGTGDQPSANQPSGENQGNTETGSSDSSASGAEEI